MEYQCLTNPNPGLGDCLSLFNTQAPIYSASPHFNTLRKYSSCNTLDQALDPAFDVSQLHWINYGGQHLFNRVRMATGLDPLDQPRAQLDLIKHKPKKIIAFSWGAGNYVNVQKRLYHPRARELYPEHHQTFQQFIDQYKSQYRFVEIGEQPVGFAGAELATCMGLDATIQILAQATHYIGMHSGLKHLATAIGVPCTIAVNFPSVSIYQGEYPAMNEWIQEMHWIYPQHQYLHLDAAEGAMRFDLDNLKRATE